jgi:hypothetical protein
VELNRAMHCQVGKALMIRCFSTLIILLLLAPALAARQQETGPDPQPVAQANTAPQSPDDGMGAIAEAGRLLLDEGVPGLRALLEQAGVPPLTFDQETQVQSVYDAHDRERRRLVEESGETDGRSLAAGITELQQQLLLAAVKFLNPAQRNALTSTIGAGLNTDLPEDEAELREYLGDLRSPGGGGGLSIDGFRGGRMPKREEIQEIRINENSFTAEQSRQGRGQTQIITRGGTAPFNGDVRFNFADESLDARNTFAATRPPFQRRNFSANLGGTVIPSRVTATFSFFNNNNEDGGTIRAITPTGLVSDSFTRPRINRGFTTRTTAQISEDHQLNFSLTYGTNTFSNLGVGGFGLAEQASNNTGNNFNFQIKETSVLSGSINNEALFQVNGNSNVSTPLNTGPSINVLDAFRGGGSSNSGENQNRNYSFGDLAMYTGRNLSLKVGFDGEYNVNESLRRQNFNGTFTFSSIDDFLARQPILYSVNQGDPVLDVSQFESAIFVQSDFRVTSRLALGIGVRYETQTNLGDNNNFDPRVGFAYSVGGSTVIRGGSGIFHQRLGTGVVGSLVRFDGQHQKSLTIRNPSYPNPFAIEDGEATVNVPSDVNTRAGDLTAPYTWNSEVSLETTLSEGLVLTSAYKFIRGVHLFRGRNLNAPFDSSTSVVRSCPARTPDETDEAREARCVRPQPDRGNINQLESTGTSRSHILRIGFRQRFSFININGSYNLDSNYSDATGAFGRPADNYDLRSEWARVSGTQRFNASANFRLPWNVNANTRFNWNTGRPYSLRTGTDDNDDTNTNDRPEGVSRNSLTGPGFFEVGMNLSKSIQLRSDRVSAEEGGPAASGGYYGSRRGIRMTITANANNLLNKVNFQSFSGVMTSPFFGKATRARDARSINLSVRLDF